MGKIVEPPLAHKIVVLTGCSIEADGAEELRLFKTRLCGDKYHACLAIHGNNEMLYFYEFSIVAKALL